MEDLTEHPQTEGPHWQRKKEQRPTEIIHAARTLFVSQGYSATKVADVAKLAGVQPGTLYVYFENKEALFKAVVESSLKPVWEMADSLLSNFHGSSQDIIRMLVQEYWDLMESDTCRGIPKLITTEAENFPELAAFYSQNVLAKAKQIIYRILEYALERKEIQLLNMEMTSRVIMLMLHEMLIYSHSFADHEEHPISPKALQNSIADFIIRSVLKPKE